ncbi:MAG: glycerophosphodiester phosphodiesterase, partial [Planctomycetaceae bacterium]|nr:glycerophosphodiester phosphodiesterase [Planctomycetaceae bacterium]
VLTCDGVDAAALIGEIRDADRESHVVVSGPLEFLKQVRNAGGTDIARLAIVHSGGMALDQLIREIDPAVVELDSDSATPELCRELHAHGIRLQANARGTTADCAEVWTRLIEAGVDAILTDHPAGVRFTDVRRRIPKFPVEIALHRGANRYAPENTLPAIELAARLQADYIEIDIQTTQDGQFVLVHDRSLDRTTNGTGPVNLRSTAEVAALDAGSWFGAPFAGLRVPTLDDGLQALGPRAHAYLDAKNIAPEALVAAIREHHLVSKHVVYQSPDYCRRLKSLDPDVRLLPPLRTLGDLDQIVDLKPYGVDAKWESLSAELIARCHGAGIRVFSDALGEHETIDDYRRAIGWGIDVIQTDFPLRVLRAVELEAPRAH